MLEVRRLHTHYFGKQNNLTRNWQFIRHRLDIDNQTLTVYARRSPTTDLLDKALLELFQQDKNKQEEYTTYI